MAKRKCWTCGGEHDLDEACGASPAVRAIRAAGGPGHELDDRTVTTFDDPDEAPELGPIFMATYDSDDACCGEGVEGGQRVRAGGHGSWIHANGRCDA